VTSKHSPEEDSNHNERPYCSSDESLLFLFVLGFMRSFCCLEHESAG
jgi:hypothetical protein